MTDVEDALDEGTDRQFEITDDGKLVENEDAGDADFEEDLTFD